MEVSELTVMVGSEQPERLAAFYRDALGLPLLPEFHDPVFRVGGAKVRIIRHSAVEGRNREPARVQINLFVEDVRAEWERLTALGVPFAREPEREGWGGMVATMEDPDGNYVQIIEQTRG